jgi:hypothetical protein
LPTLQLRLHSIEKSEIFDDMKTSRHLHSVLTAMALLCSFQGVVLFSYGILIGYCLHLMNCASTTFFALPLRFHDSHTVLKS